MPYRLQSGEPVPVGLRRLAREELDSAVALLRQANARTLDDAIHEARKSVKKVRAILRLMQVELGPTYTRENRRLRDLARRLSPYRDATVMVETLDHLRKHLPGAASLRQWAGFRRAVSWHRQRLLLGSRVTSAMRSAADGLEAASNRVRRWRLIVDGPLALEPGMETAYRRGRKAMGSVQRHTRPESCHEWRKRVKDHWYHLRLLESRWNAPARTRERRLKDLETCLGEHHNLEVLSARLTALPGDEPMEKKLWRAVIRQRQRELRAAALELGRHLYGAEPETFRKSMMELWRPARSARFRYGSPRKAETAV